MHIYILQYIYICMYIYMGWWFEIYFYVPSQPGRVT